MSSARTFIALLRGINLGAKNRVPMKELAATFAEAGCADVRTYIQSGNVIFRASRATANKAARHVSSVWGVPVLLRSAEELKQIVETNPFVTAGRPENTLHVLFLAEPPNAGFADGVDPSGFAPDELAVINREIYFYLPNGISQSKVLREPVDKNLKVACTMRNWRTTTKLLEIALAAG